MALVYFFFLLIRLPPRSTRTDTRFPYTTLFRSIRCKGNAMPQDSGTTGRYLVLLCKDRPQDGIRKLSEATGVSVASAASTGQTVRSGALGLHCAIVFKKIGVALLHCAPDRQRLQAIQSLQDDNAILAVELERTVHAVVEPEAASVDEPTVPWGVRAIGADVSTHDRKSVV